MKKIIYTAGILATLSLTLFTSCKKDTEAFPTNPQSNGVYTEFSYVTPYFPTVADASGIFVSAQVFDEKTVVVSPFVNNYEYGMAKFTNTQGNFTSLTNFGTITLNDSTLTKASDLSYLSATSTFSLNLGHKATWVVSNNPSIPTFTYSLNGVCPTYTNIITNWDNVWLPLPPHAEVVSSPTYASDVAYNATIQYSIPISQYALNSDTVIIAMMDGSGFSYVRKVASTDSVTSFKPNDFKNYPAVDRTTFNLQISPIKYQDTTIGSKNYYFLKMASYIKYYNATK